MFDLTVLHPDIERYVKWIARRKRDWSRKSDFLQIDVSFGLHNQLYDESFAPRFDDERLSPTVQVEFRRDGYLIDVAEFFYYENQVLGWSTTTIEEITGLGEKALFALNDFGPDFSRKFKQLHIE